MILTFCTSFYMKCVLCGNPNCEYLCCIHHTFLINEIEWDGHTLMWIEVGCLVSQGSSLICKICKLPPSCVVECKARVLQELWRSHSVLKICLSLTSANIWVFQVFATKWPLSDIYLDLGLWTPSPCSGIVATKLLIKKHAFG